MSCDSHVMQEFIMSCDSHVMQEFIMSCDSHVMQEFIMSCDCSVSAANQILRFYSYSQAFSIYGSLQQSCVTYLGVYFIVFGC